MPLQIDACELDSEQPARIALTVTPNISMNSRGLMTFVAVALAAMAAIEATLLAAGFNLAGAYLAVDVGFLLLALGLCRKGLQRSESIVMERGSLRIARFRRTRQIDQVRLSVFGLNLEIEDCPDYGCRRVALRQRGRCIDVGRDLSPAERSDLFDHLLRALLCAGGNPKVTRLQLPPLLLTSPQPA